MDEINNSDNSKHDNSNNNNNTQGCPRDNHVSRLLGMHQSYFDVSNSDKIYIQ